MSPLAEADLAQFEEVYGRYHQRVFGFLARLSQNRALAEDLAQETWLRYATHAAQVARLENGAKILPWLFTVARNLYLSHRRWRLIILHHQTIIPDSEIIFSETKSPFESAVAQETAQLLEAALAHLPLDYREVLLLVGVEGLEQTEAATILKLKPAALRKRLSRARTSLEKEFARLSKNIEKNAAKNIEKNNEKNAAKNIERKIEEKNHER